MKLGIAAFVLLTVAGAASAEAQGRGRNKGGVPPGHLPPQGECRVWYDGVPPGQQPPPTNCREAERIASRERARVIYGSDYARDERKGNKDKKGKKDRDRDVYDRDDERYPRDGQAVPRDRYPYPTQSRYPDSRYPETQYPDRRGDANRLSVPYRNGYEDGVLKGREDVRDGDSFDPARHSWYRSGDRGYNSRQASREEYRSNYRQGFLAGYESAYNGRDTGTSTRRRPSWWPF